MRASAFLGHVNVDLLAHMHRHVLARDHEHSGTIANRRHMPAKVH
jgi:hypothetical protein